MKKLAQARLGRLLQARKRDQTASFGLQGTLPVVPFILVHAVRGSSSASALNHCGAAKQPHTHQPLVVLQQQHGNRYVQRVLALAKNGDGRAKAAPKLDTAIQQVRGRGQTFPIPQIQMASAAIGTGLIQRRVRPGFVSCGRYPRTYPLFGVMGTTDPVSVIQAADSRAIQMLDDVIGDLEYTQSQIRGGIPAAWPTISDTVAVSLRNRFGVNPDDQDMWTSNGHRTRRGSATITLLLRRLQSIRRILAGGWIRYTCISSGCDTDDWAWTYEGEFRIRLCRSFWHASDPDNQTLTLLHEAFHIYFGATDTGRHMWNAHCIEHFVADLNEVTITADFATSCS